MNTERAYLNIIEVTYDKLTANITLIGVKRKAFPLKTGNMTRMPTITAFTQHSKATAIRQNNEIKGYLTGKGVKLYL